MVNHSVMRCYLKLLYRLLILNVTWILWPVKFEVYTLVLLEIVQIYIIKHQHEFCTFYFKAQTEMIVTRTFHFVRFTWKRKCMNIRYLPGQKKSHTLIFYEAIFGFQYNTYSLWHISHSEKLLQCHIYFCLPLHYTRIFTLILEDWEHSGKHSPAHSKDSQWG